MKISAAIFLVVLGLVVVGCNSGEKEVPYGGDVKTAPAGAGAAKPGVGKSNGGKPAPTIGLE